MKRIIIAGLIIILLVLIGIYYSRPPKIAILGYHGFTNETSDDEFVINSKDFEKQIKYLYKHHYKSLRLSDVKCFLEKQCKIPKKSVLITMDDGYKNNLDIAIPILEKYDMQAVIFYIGVNYDKENEYLNKDDLQYIKDNYSFIEIASHTYDMHYPEAYLSSKEDIKKDIEKQKTIVDSNYFAYPYGLYTDLYIETLKEEGYELAFTFGPSKNHRKVKQNDNYYEVPRLNIGSNYPYWKFILRLLLP